MSADRFVRQADLVPQDRLSMWKITVIGVGAVGRNVAVQLAAMGARQLQIIDFDHVDETNITTQGYLRHELGLPKAAALGRTLTAIEPQMQLDLIPYRFRPQHSIGDVVFCCVDSIETRAVIWRSLKNRVQFWADGRMRGEVLRLLTATDVESRQHYGATLFSAAEAQAGPCTAKSTTYAATIAAGLMLHQFARWLRGQPCECDFILNLLATELVVATPNWEAVRCQDHANAEFMGSTV